MATTIASRGAPPAKSSNTTTTTTSIPPNQTLYLKSLPDKLKKPDLKQQLYMLFSTYGPILSIINLSTTKMRGQAHITFRDQNAAIMAMRACQGMEFFGRNMVIQYAKTKSDTISKLDGTFRVPGSAGAVASKVEGEGLQKSVFDAPGAKMGMVEAAAEKVKVPVEPAHKGVQAPLAGAGEAVDLPHGIKRARDDAEEEEDVAMEEDDGSDMDMSD